MKLTKAKSLIRTLIKNRGIHLTCLINVIIFDNVLHDVLHVVLHVK